MLILLIGMAVGVGLANFVGTDSSEPVAATSEQIATECSDDEVLNVAADEAVVPIVRQLADSYIADLRESGRECIPIEVSAVSSSAVVGRLANEWRTDTHGPRPDVWIPQSTLWLELLRAQLEDKSIVPENPKVIARSPTVLAVPRPMAEQLGWPDARLSWSDFFEIADSEGGWGRYDKAGWGPFRLEMSDPRYTTTGLHGLLALDAANGDDGNLEPGSLLSLYRVQRVLANIDASSRETLRRYARADDPLRALSATPLEEREVWSFNRTAWPGDAEASEASGDGGDADEPELVAMYPESDLDVAMESDYPYVPLNTSWVSSDVLHIADEFGDYLLSDDGGSQFAAAGFRNPDNEPTDVLRSEDCLQAMDQVAAEPPGELPNVKGLRQLRRSWITVPRASRTLFLVDVSGSMKELVPETGQTRLEATVDAAELSLDVIPARSQVGLWEFSTDLPGGQNGGDYRVLVKPGRLDQTIGGQLRKDRIVERLRALDPENDTALNDTLVGAYRSMRREWTPGRQHTIVLLTDGRNDDDRSLTHEQTLSALARATSPQRPIDVVSIAYGDGPDLDKLAEISEVTGGRVLSAPSLDNLDRQLIRALRR